MSFIYQEIARILKGTHSSQDWLRVENTLDNVPTESRLLSHDIVEALLHHAMGQKQLSLVPQEIRQRHAKKTLYFGGGSKYHRPPLTDTTPEADLRSAIIHGFSSLLTDHQFEVGLHTTASNGQDPYPTLLTVLGEGRMVASGYYVQDIHRLAPYYPEMRAAYEEKPHATGPTVANQFMQRVAQEYVQHQVQTRMPKLTPVREV